MRKPSIDFRDAGRRPLSLETVSRRIIWDAKIFAKTDYAGIVRFPQAPAFSLPNDYARNRFVVGEEEHGGVCH